MRFSHRRFSLARTPYVLYVFLLELGGCAGVCVRHKEDTASAHVHAYTQATKVDYTNHALCEEANDSDDGEYLAAQCASVLVVLISSAGTSARYYQPSAKTRG